MSFLAAFFRFEQCVKTCCQKKKRLCTIDCDPQKKKKHNCFKSCRLRLFRPLREREERMLPTHRIAERRIRCFRALLRSEISAPIFSARSTFKGAVRSRSQLPFSLSLLLRPNYWRRTFFPYSSRLSDIRTTPRCPESALPIKKCPRFFKNIRFGIGRIDSETVPGWSSKMHVLSAAPSASTDSPSRKGCVKQVMLRGSGCRPVRSR